MSDRQPPSKAPSSSRQVGTLPAHSKSAGALQIGAFQILHFDSIDSTNLEAMRQAKSGASEGLCIIAREQTRGRGRLDRSWHSPKDAGLYLSIVLRPKFDLARWPLISLAAALAVHDAIFRVCDLKVDIKWPNDICVRDRKLCGILAETVETEIGLAAIVGIGINLYDENFPAELEPHATSLRSVTGSDVDRDHLVNELSKALSERYEMLNSGSGDEHTIREWCANSSYAFGRMVRVSLGDENLVGVTRGLESDGALRIETADGKLRSARAGDVTALRAHPSDNS
ncbi:MAG: biotin--[acetyl-CoA-carboxylase] ligase [Pyrinomonadaceae bacterium]